MRHAIICEVSMEEFLCGGVAQVVIHSGEQLAPEEVVAMTNDIGRTGYDSTLNNCEHFASHCKTTRRVSRQAARALKAAGIAVAGVALSTGMVLARAYLQQRARKTA